MLNLNWVYAKRDMFTNNCAVNPMTYAGRMQSQSNKHCCEPTSLCQDSLVGQYLSALSVSSSSDYHAACWPSPYRFCHLSTNFWYFSTDVSEGLYPYTSLTSLCHMNLQRPLDHLGLIFWLSQNLEQNKVKQCFTAVQHRLRISPRWC